MASMMPTMAPDAAHKDIPGNPSTAKSSHQKLNDRSNGVPLRVLSEADWQFWQHNGYIVIKNAVPKEQAERLAEAVSVFKLSNQENQALFNRVADAPAATQTVTTARAA